MRFFAFIVESFVFKRFVILTVLFLALLWITNKVFDSFWDKTASVPLLDLNVVYKPPKQYDNFKRLNIKLSDLDKIAIEANKRFRIDGSQKAFDFYDTAFITYPVNELYFTNKIFLEFEGSRFKDSIYLVISKSYDEKLYWKQIFLSSVIISKLNSFSDDPQEFRINENSLVEQSLLDDNDTLIHKALNYFEENKDKLKTLDCGTNCATFSDLCSKFNLPCREVGLMGGDADQLGYNDYIGYPMHAICEVYSSKHKKWYVIDPTFGFRFKNSGSDDFLNAVEINNMILFQRDKFIVQDSILSKLRPTLDLDYFKYYENIYYKLNYRFIRPLRIFLKYFYPKFVYVYYHFTNNLSTSKNGFYYITTKSFIYLLINLLYLNSILIVITRRLFMTKKPKY